MNDYRTINLCFVVILFFGLIYCFFLKEIPTDIQIKSNCYGEPFCKSVGLTRAFNAALNLNFEKAFKFNPYYFQTLIFFLVQFTYRIVATFFIKKIGIKTIRIDTILTAIYFLFTFHVFVI